MSNETNQLHAEANNRAGLLFAGAVALVILACVIVARDYDETRSTAIAAAAVAATNSQSITTVSEVQRNLSALLRDTDKQVRALQIEQARFKIGR